MPEPSPSPTGSIERELGRGARVEEIPPDAATLQALAVEARPEAPRRKKRLGIGAWIAIAWMVVVVGGAILSPVLPVPDPVSDAETSAIRQGPSVEHPLGADTQGRDLLSRVIYGARNTLTVAAVSIAAGFVAGGILGLVAGYFKGRIGGFLGALTDLLLAFPQLVLALAIVTFLGHEMFYVILALAIVSTPVLARIARASALSWSEREFVTAARAQGATHVRVMTRELLPNVLPAMFSIALLGVAIVIIAEAGLAIIGAGVKPNVVTWGNVIVGGQADLSDAPHIVLAPSIAIFLTVLALNYLGDVVRERFDVREAAL